MPLVHLPPSTFPNPGGSELVSIPYPWPVRPSVTPDILHTSRDGGGGNPPAETEFGLILPSRGHIL